VTRAPAPRRLIVNADDLGLSAGVNRGIVACATAGVVTSASLLVNTPGFADAAAQLNTGAPLDVGLHLNLTTGTPVAGADAVPSLCDARTGRLYPLVALIARALARRISSAEVALECAAQIARARAAGIRLTHLDGHEHVHVLPGVWRPVVETARRAGIEVVRVPLEPPRSLAWRPAAVAGQVLITAAYRVAARGVPPPRHPDHFRGFALTGRRDFAARLLRLLDALDAGTTELMVHPGHEDADLTGWVRYAVGRERELDALVSPGVRARLRQGDIELTNFGLG